MTNFVKLWNFWVPTSTLTQGNTLYLHRGCLFSFLFFFFFFFFIISAPNIDFEVLWNRAQICDYINLWADINTFLVRSWFWTVNLTYRSRIHTFLMATFVPFITKLWHILAWKCINHGSKIRNFVAIMVLCAHHHFEFQFQCKLIAYMRHVLPQGIYYRWYGMTCM